MTLATRIFVVWTLCLTVFWLAIYGLMSRHFDGSLFAQKRVAALQARMQAQERRVAQLQFRFNEYKDFLASQGVRIEENSAWSDPRRMIASVMSDGDAKANLIPIVPGNSVMANARKLFSQGQFLDAQQVLTGLVRDYPDNPNLPEAAFLLMESQAARGQTEAIVKSVNFIVSQFPETEYAAYAMVRLGKIFEKQELLEEACDIYRVVVREFPNSPAAQVADERLKDLRL